MIQSTVEITMPRSILAEVFVCGASLGDIAACAKRLIRSDQCVGANVAVASARNLSWPLLLQQSGERVVSPSLALPANPARYLVSRDRHSPRRFGLLVVGHTSSSVAESAPKLLRGVTAEKVWGNVALH